jgi:sirohydrochlorin ferrochelatase
VRDQHGVPPVILSATLFGGVMADRIASAADGLEVVGPIGTFAEVQRAIRARVAEVRAGVSDAARPRRRARVRQVVATLTRR